MKNNPDLKQMSGKQLFEIITPERNRNIQSLCKCWYIQHKILKVLLMKYLNVAKGNKKPFPFYPGIGRDARISEDELNSFEYIGDIIDGKCILFRLIGLLKITLLKH